MQIIALYSYFYLRGKLHKPALPRLRYWWRIQKSSESYAKRSQETRSILQFATNIISGVPACYEFIDFVLHGGTSIKNEVDEVAQDAGRRPTISLGVIPGKTGKTCVLAKFAAASSSATCSGYSGSPPHNTFHRRQTAASRSIPGVLYAMSRIHPPGRSAAHTLCSPRSNTSRGRNIWGSHTRSNASLSARSS